VTGLRSYTRDGRLPAQFGDEALCLLEEDEVLRLVREHLSESHARTYTSTELIHARWKPGVSSAATYILSKSKGRSRTLTIKRYATSKAADIAASYRPSPFAEKKLAKAGLKPFYADPAERMCAFTYPADRMLPGLPRALDRKRATRMVEELLGLDDMTLKRHATKLELLRYKPERRAVMLLETVRREGDLSERFLLRVHPPAVAAAAARSRASCATIGEQGLGPRFIGCEERTGTLLEEMLAGRAPAPDCFDHAEQMGALLARLHALPCPTNDAAAASAREEVADWFHFAPELQHSALGLSDLAPRSTTSWIHGDVHPDQVLIDELGNARLIDLDGLAVGDPQVDLGSWICDHLMETDEVGFEDAAAPLLAGYRNAGGRPGETASLVRLVVHELALRAAASLRRMQVGALDRAHDLLERARALGAEGKTP